MFAVVGWLFLAMVLLAVSAALGYVTLTQGQAHRIDASANTRSKALLLFSEVAVMLLWGLWGAYAPFDLL